MGRRILEILVVGGLLIYGSWRIVSMSEKPAQDGWSVPSFRLVSAAPRAESDLLVSSGAERPDATDGRNERDGGDGVSSPDRRFVSIGRSIWDLSTRRIIGQFVTGRPYDISHDGKWVLIDDETDGSSEASVWSLEDGRLVAHMDGVGTLKASQDWQFVSVSRRFGRKTYAWRIADGVPVRLEDLSHVQWSSPVKERVTSLPSEWSIEDFSLSPSGRYLILKLLSKGAARLGVFDLRKLSFVIWQSLEGITWYRPFAVFEKSSTFLSWPRLGEVVQ